MLVLYWYNKDYPWNVNFDRNFQAVLQSAPARRFEYYPEYLETDRFPGEHQSRLLHDHLLQKYADRSIDVLVATSDASLNFLIKYRADLFPQAPIVFVVTRTPPAEQLAAGPGMTGLNVLTDHRRTVDLALSLHPETKHLFIVSGTLEHDKRLETLARAQLQSYESRVAIEYLTDLRPEELIAKTKALPEQSLVLYVWQQARSDQGRVLETQEILTLFVPSVRAPIYGMTNLYIGQGAVGGYINLAEATGARAGEIATQVANGVRPQDIPVANAPLVPIFDWRELRRWGISENRLPANSVVRFKETSLWDQYRWQIIGIISLFLVEAVLIFALLAQRARRSRAEEGLRRVSERLQLATGAASIGIWDWDVVNDELIWDDAMYRLYGVRKEDFTGAVDAWTKSLAPEDFMRANAELQATLRGEQEFATEFRVVWPDGSVHFIKAVSQTFRNEEGRPLRMVGVNYDITERRLVEEQIALLHTLTMDVAASRDLPSALEVVLRRVCEKTGWELGQAWVPRQDGTGLDCCPGWFAAAASLEEFRALSRDTILSTGIGLPGRVWSSRQPVWIRDVTQDKNFPRAEAARKSGLKAAFAVPILSGDDVIAVLEFFLSEPREEDERLVKLISAVAAQIGLVFERKLAEESLRLSEERFAKAFQASPVPIALLNDRDRTFLEVNERWETVFGFSREETVGRTALELNFFKVEDRDRLRALGESQGYLRDEELDVRTKQGETRHVTMSAERFMIGGELCNLCLFSDITERKRAEEALRESERRFSDSLKNIEMIAVMADMKGDITFCNDYFLRVTGWKREEAIGRNWYEMFLPEGEKAKVSELLNGVEPTGEVIVHMENEIKTRSGERRLVKWTNTTLRGLDGQVIGVAALGDDITERKAAEEQLRSSTAQLRALSARLQSAREEEGTRIAREIHDELGGALTGLKWDLERIDRALPDAGNVGEMHSVHQKILTMTGLVDTTINTVRRISSELRPSVLDDLGLVSAIEWHAQQFQERTGIICRFDSLLEHVDLNREQATAVFRIFQEAMTNVLRHAQATKVNIIIEEEEGEFIVEIKDNGRGIMESERSGIHSLGLVGMRERANSVGGRVKINGVAGKGTAVIVRLRIKNERDILRLSPALEKSTGPTTSNPRGEKP